MRLLVLLALVTFSSCAQEKKEKEETLYSVNHTDKEWKELLTDKQYNILRRSHTEPRFSSKLNDEKRDGLFFCAADSTQLFRSVDKFDSGTGWPSFDAANNLEYEWDGRALEVRCFHCGGHLGHLFKDEGFTEKDLRYCINGDAMFFLPLEELDKLYK